MLRAGQVVALGTWQEVVGLALPELCGIDLAQVEVSVDEAVEIATGKPELPSAHQAGNLSSNRSRLSLNPPTLPFQEDAEDDNGMKAKDSKPSVQEDPVMPAGYPTTVGTQMRLIEGNIGNGPSRGREPPGDEPTATIVIQVDQSPSLIPADSSAAATTSIGGLQGFDALPSVVAADSHDSSQAARTASSVVRAKAGGLSRERTFKFLTQRREPDPVRAPTDAGSPFVYEEGPEAPPGAEKGPLWSRLARSLSSRWFSGTAAEEEDAASRNKSMRIKEAAGESQYFKDIKESVLCAKCLRTMECLSPPKYPDIKLRG